MSSIWTAEINAKLPSLWDGRDADVEKILAEAFDNILEDAKKFESTICDHLKQKKMEIVGVKTSVDNRVKQSIDSFQRRADALGPTMRSIRDAMTDAFDECERFTGQYTHVITIVNITDLMQAEDASPCDDNTWRIMWEQRPQISMTMP